MKNYLLLLSLCFTQFAFAQSKEAYTKHWLIEDGDSLPYRLLLPKDYNPSKKYPLVLFLHGAGERGKDNEAQLMHGWKFFLQDSVREKYPAIVVFPQCPQESYWSNVDVRYDTAAKERIWRFLDGGKPTFAMKMVLELLDELEDEYPIDEDRMYVGGLSMGGMGTFELVRRKPKMFAAAFPICGGANVATAKKLTKTKWWIFHGLKDDVVPAQLSQDMAHALRWAGADVQLTLYPDANHNSWDPAFAEKELISWLFAQHK